jgi:hypothetical protein
MRTIAPEQRIVFVRRDQQEAAARYFRRENVIVVAGVDELNWNWTANSEAPTAVLGFLRKQPASVGPVHLASFCRTVLSLPTEMTFPFDIEPLTFKQLRAGIPWPPNRSSEFSARTDESTLTVDQAIPLIRRMIEDGQFDTPTPRASVQMELEKLDKRFRDVDSNVVALVIAEAVREGWLNRVGASSSEAFQRPHVHPVRSPADDEVEHAVEPDREVARPENQNDLHSRGHYSGNNSAPSEAVSPVPTLSESTSYGSSPEGSLHNASSHLDACELDEKLFTYLRSRKRGPFSRLRPKLYEEIENVLDRGDRISINELVREAVGKAMSALDGEDLDSKRSENLRKVPWKAVCRFSIDLLASARVLIDADMEDHVLEIPRHGLTEPTTIKTISNWRLVCEGVLFKELLSGPVQISEDDLDTVAGVLMADRKSGYIYLHEVIEHLYRGGQIEIGDDGVYRARTQTTDGSLGSPEPISHSGTLRLVPHDFESPDEPADTIAH